MKEYWDYSNEYIRQYDNDEFEPIFVSIRRRQLLKALESYKHEHILEVGCGLEPLFSHFDDYKTYTIVEPIKEFVCNARTLCSNDNRFTIVQGKIEDVCTQLNDKVFDFIILSSLLHEIPNPREVLEITWRLSNDSTTIYVDVPNTNSFHRLLGFEMGIIKSLEEKSELEIRFDRQHHFNSVSLVDLLKKAGFEVINSFTFFVKPFSSRQMNLMLKSGIIDESAIRGLEKMTKYFPNSGSLIAAEARKANNKLSLRENGGM